MNHFSQLPAIYLVHPWLTTQLSPWTNEFVPTLWKIANARTELDIFLVQKNSNYLDVKMKAFKKDDNKDFQLVQKLTMGEADLSQFIRLRNQLAIAAETFVREENLSPVMKSTLSEDMDKQLKLALKVIDVLEQANRMIYVTLLQYSVDKPEFLCSSPNVCKEEGGQ